MNPPAIKTVTSAGGIRVDVYEAAGRATVYVPFVDQWREYAIQWEETQARRWEAAEARRRAFNLAVIAKREGSEEHPALA